MMNSSKGLWAVLDNPQLLANAFYPRKTARSLPSGARDFNIQVASGVNIGARYHIKDKALRTVLFFHGNGETVPDYNDIAQEYRHIGLNFFVVDYRGYGWSGGTPSFRAMHDDTPKIVEFFLDKIEKTAPAPLVMGRSLGSGPACDAAMKYGNKFGGLILESGFGDVIPLLRLFQFDPGRHEKEISDLFSNHLKLQKVSLPVLIIHGDNDNLIPAGAAKQNYLNIRHNKKKLILIPGAGHNDLLLRKGEYFKAIEEFVKSL